MRCWTAQRERFSKCGRTDDAQKAAKKCRSRRNFKTQNPLGKEDFQEMKITHCQAELCVASRKGLILKSVSKLDEFFRMTRASARSLQDCRERSFQARPCFDDCSLLCGGGRSGAIGARPASTRAWGRTPDVLRLISRCPLQRRQASAFCMALCMANIFTANHLAACGLQRQHESSSKTNQ